MKKYIPAIILLVISVALTVVSLLVLPDTVTTQLSFSGAAASTMPRLYAVLLPAVLSAGGAVASFFDKRNSKKSLLVSAVGILVFVIMLVVNR